MAVTSRGALSLSLLPLAAPSRTAGNSQPAWQTWVAELEKEIPKRMEETNVPGLSIAIIRGGNIAWRQGFGVSDAEARTPVDLDTIFEAGSMSKAVFAYAVLKLCEKGVLALDAPLTNYAPEQFLKDDARLELITARHVLSHTAGFQNWRSGSKPLKIHSTPGQEYRYSGEGYFYLQSIVTHLTGHVDPNDCATFEADLKVCGTDIDAYLKTNLLRPFGMASSGYLWAGSYEKHAARPHDSQGKPLSKKKPKSPFVARYGAAGGLHTTPTEYARFLAELINAKPEDAFRLKKETLAEMVRPHVKTNDEQRSWALGWQITHTKQGDIICHGGYNKGFHSFAAASLEHKSGYVVMTNGDGAGDLLQKLALSAEAPLNRFLAT